MKILISPDKFKGSLTAFEAAEAMAAGFRRSMPEAVCSLLPLADGGEGTARILTEAVGGTMIFRTVSGPLGTPVRASYGCAGKKAFLEMAESSGLALVPGSRRDPRKTATFGFGELIRDAMDRGCREFILGIGGSATNDGGAGMAEALGFVFQDETGTALSGLCGGNLLRIAGMDLSGADPRLKECSFQIASDVENPLLGPRGCSEVYAPQKGADPAAVRELERNLRHWKDLLEPGPGEGLPGDGAAGGLGFGLRVLLQAVSVSGAELVMKATSFAERLREADLLVTGEGCSDRQTLEGKLCARAARAARQAGKLCLLLSGALGAPRCELQNCFPFILTSSAGRSSWAEIQKYAAEDLETAAASAGTLLGMSDKEFL